jgi:N-methylhydantoinase A
MADHNGQLYGEVLVLFVAVDIGGTFTDLVAFDDETGKLFDAKRLTTYGNFADGIFDCFANSGLEPETATQIIHGSTIAINTLIERKGARTALLVTRGTRDVYAIGRGNRPDSYNLFFKRPKPLTPRSDIYEVDERMLAGGIVHQSVDETQIVSIGRELAARGFQSAAVCFLHSYANPAHEVQVGNILRSQLKDTYVSLSHEILREYREYERISTTAVNAYIGPRVSGYVSSLAQDLAAKNFRGDLSIMQSNGGVMSPEVASKRPVMMMESGPVGGIIACAEVAGALGYRNSISFDMGGTTAKASLVHNGIPSMAEGYYVGGYQSGDPVMIPVVDVIEVGAGGGSIAWIDEVGALKVGPHSAGSTPGPMCYGLGGDEPAITDANVVLGRIDPEAFLGGEMRLDLEKAKAGIQEKIAEPLGLSLPAAARAIIDIAIAKMSLAVRQVSVEKGHDPRDFALVASGGAGPLHAVAIARELRIPKVIIPWFPSHFSALGMLMADERHDIVQTWPASLETLDFAALGQAIDGLAANLRDTARNKNVQIEYYLDLRYTGQEFSLPVSVTREQVEAAEGAAIIEAFGKQHKERYEHNAEGEPVEMINIRLVARAPCAKPVMPYPGGHAAALCRQLVYMHADTPEVCEVYQRSGLSAGVHITGPALIQEYGSTTVLFPGDRCEVVPTGELLITLAAAAGAGV